MLSGGCSELIDGWGLLFGCHLLIWGGGGGGYCVESFVYWVNWWLLCEIFCGVCVVAVVVLECGLVSLRLLVLFGMKWCVLIWRGYCVVSLGCFVNMVVVVVVGGGLLCGVFGLFC